MSEQGYLDDTVSEGTLMHFLTEYIEVTGNLKQPAGEGEEPVELGTDGYEQWIKAIVDLYKQQKSLGRNDNAHLRSSSLRCWKQGKHFYDRARSRSSFQDRGVGSIQDGYTPEEMLSVCDYFFISGREIDHRDRMTFLLQHMLLLRGELSRMVELPDLFTIDFDEGDLMHCPALVIQFDAGKRNPKHKKEYSVTIRHKNVKKCAFGAMALYFFSRWHVNGEPFPTFVRSEDWFSIKVCTATSMVDSMLN